MTTLTMHDTKIDLTLKSRKACIELLQAALVDGISLYQELKQAHWNIKGRNFYQLHLLFDTLADDVNGYIDTIAERITALGGTACGSSPVVAKHSRLKLNTEPVFEETELLNSLIDNLARFGKDCRTSIDEATSAGDANTADLFTEVSRGTDKNLYFLEAHLQA
jgi:starvation-inducible DNA-binding protein